jgi:hypothetical protein
LSASEIRGGRKAGPGFRFTQSGLQTAQTPACVASAPPNGFGQSGSVLQRATMWMCSYGTTLPSAATLILSHRVASFSASEANAPVR